MPYASSRDYNNYMRRYREKNRERINEQRLERKAWRIAVDNDDRRARASEEVDRLLSELDPATVSSLYSVLARCSPMMIDDLVARAKRLI